MSPRTVHCSPLPAVAVPGVPALEIERTHTSHLLPNSPWMGQGQAKVTRGLHLNGSYICWVLAGAEGQCDLMFPTQSPPNSLLRNWQSQWTLSAYRKQLQYLVQRIWIRMRMLAAETKGHIADHQHDTFWQMKNPLLHSPNLWKSLTYYHGNKRIVDASIFFNETRAKIPMLFHSLLYFYDSPSYVFVFGVLFICVQTKRACWVTFME